MAEEIGDLVRRVVGRVLAERGLAPERSSATPGAQVVVGEPPRPAEELSRPSHRGPSLLDVDGLAGLAEGAVLELPAGALVTPLAREEASRRGIRLREGSGVRGGARLRVALGADHSGFARKEELAQVLRELGHEVADHGTQDESPVDYPDLAAAVARAVTEGRADLGVVIDGAGIGSAMAANKVPGARAATCWDEASARNAREHNFANVLALGARSLDRPACERVLRAFLATPEGAPRHERRVAKIAELERAATGRALPLRRVLAPRPEEPA
jgi:ribose 5-phosphate isomerase B